MEARKLQCQTFIKNSGAMPSLDDMVKATDPQELEQLFREAGLEFLADNIDTIQRADMAAENYFELSEADYQLYNDYLSRTVALENCPRPPNEVLTALIPARRSRFFDDITVLTHPVTGEALLLGRVKISDRIRRFKIGHWGYHLTTIKELRRLRRRREFRKAAARIRRLAQWRPQINLGASSGSRGSLYFGAVTLLAAAPCWLILRPFSWFLFAGVLIVMMVACCYYTSDQTRSGATQRAVVGWIVAANIIAAIVVGIVTMNSWFTTNRTEDVLVCGSSEGFNDWQISTSAGGRSLEGGFYNGTYFSNGSQSLAESLVGNWVRLTEHGYAMGDTGRGPYVTGAQTLRPGSCG